MGLSNFFEGLGFELRQLLWKDGPPPEWIRVRRNLKAILSQKTETLLELHHEMDELAWRVERQRRREAALSERVQVYLHVRDRRNAYRKAIELDRLRATIERDMALLEDRRRSYRHLRADIQPLQEELAELKAALYSNG